MLLPASPADSLPHEIAAASQLLELLKQEQAELIRANVDVLDALIEKKSQAVSRMTELALARHRSLANAGMPASETGMEQWMKQLKSDSAAARSWRKLLDVTAAAKEINRTNGILIHTHMSRTQGALDALRGGAQANTLYGPNGQASAKQGGRGLVVG